MEYSKIFKLQEDIIKMASQYKNETFAKRLFSIAQGIGAAPLPNALDWLKSSKAQIDLKDLSDPFVLSTLKFMVTVKESHPSGISSPDLLKYMMVSENQKYLPTMIDFNTIFEQQGSQLLEPFRLILEATKPLTLPRESDGSQLATVKKSLDEIDKAFRVYQQSLINKPYGDDPMGNKGKLNKEEKKKELFNYLIDSVSEKIISTLSQYDFDVIADEMRNDRMFLVDSKKLYESKLMVDKRSFEYMAQQAQAVAKTILKRVEPSDNEYNYNLLVNSAMKFNTFLSDEEYDEYFYNLMLEKGRNPSHKPSRKEFKPNEWLNQNVIAFFHLTLSMIMAQVRL